MTEFNTFQPGHSMPDFIVAQNHTNQLEPVCHAYSIRYTIARLIPLHEQAEPGSPQTQVHGGTFSNIITVI